MTLYLFVMMMMMMIDVSLYVFVYEHDVRDADMTKNGQLMLYLILGKVYNLIGKSHILDLIQNRTARIEVRLLSK